MKVFCVIRVVPLKARDISLGLEPMVDYEDPMLM